MSLILGKDLSTRRLLSFLKTFKLDLNVTAGGTEYVFLEYFEVLELS